MEDSGINKPKVYAAEKSEKVEPNNRMSRLRDEESLGTVVTDTKDLLDEGVLETLDKDQVEGVREISCAEPNGEDVREVNETENVKETAVSAIVPVDEVEENCELETSPSDPATDSTAQGLALVSILSKAEQRSDSRVVKKLPVSPVPRTRARDGYNWRKYGQKQVKSPKGSRSYYRCTYSECCAKKIECSNDLGNIVEIVNRGLHSHEPLRKSSFCPREIRVASAFQPVSEDSAVAGELAIVRSSSDLSASTKENICESQTSGERKRHCEDESVDESEPKRRLKKDDSQSSDSVSKPGKKNRFVVHAAGDVGISGDGYRWRKYGQKMVKGNPHPRNYYRCTSAGCPVRKHIETAVENTSAVIITYKGVHNHDMPVPKKRHGPPSSVLVAAVAPTSMRTRSDDQVNIPTSGQFPVGRESEKQSSEAAKTLLSIGFEIKQC